MRASSVVDEMEPRATGVVRVGQSGLLAAAIAVALVVGAGGGFAVGRAGRPTANTAPPQPQHLGPGAPERLPLPGGGYAEVRTVPETYSPSRQCGANPGGPLPPDAVQVGVTFTTYPAGVYASGPQPASTVAYYVVGQNPVTVLVDPHDPDFAARLGMGLGLPPEFCPRILH
jgi:hypothetical protein